MKRFVRRVLAIVRRDPEELALDREVAAHLMLLEDDFRRRGLSADEARVAARRALGGVDQTKERHRDARSFPWLEDLRRDVPYALRGLRRSPGFTAAAVITLALGIGATTAVFSVVNTILLEPLPYAQSDRLVRIVEPIPARQSGRPPTRRPLTRDELLEWQARTQTLAGMAGAQWTPQTIMPTARGAVRLSGALVSREYFSLLGTQALIGRTLRPDDESGNPDVVVLAFKTWQRHFQSDPQVLGTNVTLQANAFDDTPFTVVGIMPPDFVDPTLPTNEFWAPLVIRPSQWRATTIYLGAVLGLLKTDVSLTAAREEANAIGNAMAPRSPTPEGGANTRHFEVRTLREEVVAPIRPALQVFLAAVAVLLLIVCANVANLLLARGTARQREIAMRLAIGAGRARIVRQMLTESLVLAAIGGTLGAVVGAAGIALVKSLATVSAPGIFRLAFGGDILPRLTELSVDSGMLGVAVAISVATSVIFGLIPAVQLSRVGQLRALGARSITGSSHARLRSGLAVGQLAMATALLVVAGLLANSFVKLATVHTGYDATNVLAFQLVLPPEYPTARKVETIEALLARLRQVPGALAAGFSYAGALVGLENTVGYFVPPGQTDEEMQREINRPRIRSVSSGYLEAIGVQLLDGRMLNAGDLAKTPIPILVNRAMARRYFGDESPVGVAMHWRSTTGPLGGAGNEGAIVPREAQVEIVGVVDDVRQGRLDQEPTAEFYIDYRQTLALQQRWGARTVVQELLALGTMSFAVRTTGDPNSLASTVAGTIASVDSNAGIDAMAPMDRLVATSIARPRFYAVVLGLFAGIAALLAAVGIYGILAYAVGQRTQEIGVRMALGADRRAVLALILRQGLLLPVIGISTGLCAATGATRYVQTLLYGVTPLDPRTFVAVAASFALVTLLASYLPARRATKVEPMVALRCD